MSIQRMWRNAIHKSPSRQNRKIAYTALPLETPIEEETLRYYKPEHYYPVKIGDVYKKRYQIAGKIGYGAYSTSWLCHDLQYVFSHWCPAFY